MLGQFNAYFHYFFVAFFLASAVLFWFLDRKRWQDYRAAADKFKLKFSKDLPAACVRKLCKRFDFFNREQMQVFSALFEGVFQEKQVKAFHYAYQGRAEDTSYRRGFACFTMSSEVDLPDFYLWPEARPCPFANEPPSLQGFFLDNPMGSRFHIAGREGASVRAVFQEKVTAGFLEQGNLVVECRAGYLLIALEAEWIPNRLGDMLQNCHDLLTSLEKKQERVAG